MRADLYKLWVILFFIFVLGLFLRFETISQNNVVFGFDQVRDFFDSRSIFFDKNLRIVGPTAGNNPNLHHGVLFLYYILPPILIFGGNPFWVAVWNSVLNASILLLMYFFAKEVFKSKLSGVIAALLTAVSYQFVQFSGWLSNPTVTLFTVPIFYFGIWKYSKGAKLGLVLAAFALGLSIQFELFFLHLLFILVILWVLLRLKFPTFMVGLASFLAFSIATSTMILTEIKFKFAGIRAIPASFLNPSQGGVDRFEFFGEFLDRYWKTFSLNLLPSSEVGKFLGIAIIVFLFYRLIRYFRDVDIRKQSLFVLVYLFSPFLLAFFGYHAAPWFLVGLPGAVILGSSFVISSLRPKILIVPLILLVMVSNIRTIEKSKGMGQILLEPDKSSILSYQIRAVDYTYQSSSGEPFAVNSVTNPLYINAVWAYHYDWYGLKRYGYKPSWMGGDQLPPYDTLSREKGDAKYLYLIMDTNQRIPEVYRTLAKNWANERSSFIEEKVFGEIVIQKRRLLPLGPAISF